MTPNVSFSLGPVQDFIAASRTTRDLWTGSFLLSHLTGKAVAAVCMAGGELVFPAVGQGGPESAGHIPNTFVAGVPESAVPEMAEACRTAVLSEWRKISQAVREAMQRWPDMPVGWDEGWDAQLENFWDIRVVVLSAGAAAQAAGLGLLGQPLPSPGFDRDMAYLQRLAAAQKLIRHYPPHEPGDQSNKPETRPKCSLLGTYAQMGPVVPGGQLRASQEFWKHCQGQNVQGVRLGRADRLCAVSLVKRFAWPAYLKTHARPHPDLQFPDVDTVCAGQWLAEVGADADLQWNRLERGQNWSGHWLRWRKNLSAEEAADEGEDLCPPEVWEKISQARGKMGSVPAYYMVLAMDGDKLGETLRGADHAGYKKISGELSRFADTLVPETVKKYHGTLIYAGGDDVLALLPTKTGLACAGALSKAFSALQFPAAKPTASTGLAVVHWKENLRLALIQARAAEAHAKASGRNRLALSVMRRGGQGVLQSCLWTQAPILEELVEGFSAGASDGWAYSFREELATLVEEGSAGHAMRAAELWRLLGRSEKMPVPVRAAVKQLWQSVPDNGAGAREFIDMVQAAAFLARVPKE